MHARLEQTLVGLLQATAAKQARVTSLSGTPAVEVVLSSRASIIFPTADGADPAEVLDRARRLAAPQPRPTDD